MVTEKYEKSMYFKTFSECEVYMVGCVKIWPMRVKGTGIYRERLEERSVRDRGSIMKNTKTKA